MIKNNYSNILYGHGIRWSKAASEAEEIFESWLKVSGIEEKEFFKRIKDESFSIDFHSHDEIVLINENGKIGESFLYDKSQAGEYKNFLTEAGFILLYISSKCDCKNSSEKIKKFIKNNLLKEI